MNALPELAEWSKDLAPWLSDMARRAVLKGTLDASDHEDLTAILLASVGVPDPSKRESIRLDAEMIPVRLDPGDSVALTAIREPVHVNALDEKASLLCAEEGLTVIWGQNGAGKSGFVRILKRACRSRDQEPILPNVFVDGQTGVPQAKLAWKSPSGIVEKQWIDGQSKHDDLSKIVIFDGRCARLFVDDEQEVNIVVYGVDVLREMARACQEVKRRLETKQTDNRFDLSVLDPLRGETAVGGYIQSLSAKSNKQAAQELATLTNREKEELKTLDEQLANDPVRKSAALRRLVQRLKVVRDELDSVKESLSDQKVEALRNAMAAYKTADEASRLASQDLSEDGTILTGTGNDPWRDLLASAIAFAQQAYPGENFPAERDDVRCILCQQPLSDEAKTRLKRFVDFIRADAQKKREATRNAVALLYKAIENAAPARLPSDQTILDEAEELDSGLKECFCGFVDALESRRTKLIEQSKSRDILIPIGLPPGPFEHFRELSRKLDEQALNFDKAAQAEARKQLVQRFNELSAHTKLADMLPLVTQAIDSLSLQVKLDAALKQTNTNAITRKSTELTELAITNGLNTSLNAELQYLKIGSLKLEIGLRGQKGQGMQQIKLNVRKPLGKAKVSDILSEGEQRAIAIACFLAETNLVSQKTSIVLDDPVSSMDNYRRELVARRLATEARNRQVVVFTHELSFAWDLIEAAKKSGAKSKACRVYSVGPNKGVVADGLPHEGGKIGARINDLDQLATKAKKTLEVDKDPDKYETLVRDGYRKLRDAWERLIEECLFGDTVRRFRNSVETKKLRLAEVEDQDVKDVEAGMTKCSLYTHDVPEEAPPAAPQPDDFAADINHFRLAHSRIEARMKVTEKRRDQS
jgi:energy-coupling factor transporter ATP-binding protein EcfA2